MFYHTCYSLYLCAYFPAYSFVKRMVILIKWILHVIIEQGPMVYELYMNVRFDNYVQIYSSFI